MSARAIGLTLLLAGCASGTGAATGAAPTTNGRDSLPTGTLIVANQGSANATIIDLPSGATRTAIAGTGPHEAMVGSGAGWGLVTVYGDRTSVGNQLAIIDPRTGTVVRHIDLGTYRRPHGAVQLPGPARRVVVTSEATQHVVLVNVDRDSIEGTIGTGAPGSHMIAVTADGTRGFTANMPAGSVSELDLVGRKLLRTMPVNAPATEGLAVLPDGREVWVGSNQAGTVSVLDTRTGTVAAVIPGFRVPYRLGITPDGRTALVVDAEANVLHVVDVATRRVTGAVAGLDAPRGVATSPDSRFAFVTLAADGAVAVVEIASRRIVATYPVGTAPDGVGFAAR